MPLFFLPILVGLEELNSQLFGNNSDVTTKHVYSETCIKRLSHFIFLYLFLLVPVLCEHNLYFCSCKINSLALSPKGWGNGGGLACQAWWLTALLQPLWPGQGWSSCSTAVRSIFTLWVSCSPLQRESGTNYLEKSISIQITPSFFLSFLQHHPRSCNFWYTFLEVGHTYRIPCGYRS